MLYFQEDGNKGGAAYCYKHKTTLLKCKRRTDSFYLGKYQIVTYHLKWYDKITGLHILLIKGNSHDQVSLFHRENK